MLELLDMGKYGWYVWPAYGLTFFILIFNAIVPSLKERRLREQISRRLRREARSEQS